MAPEQWFEGIYLLGRFNWFQTGCWLLAHRGEAAILEMPPPGLNGPQPADVAREAVGTLAVTSVRYLLCTHAHYDHFSRQTFRAMRSAFPDVKPCLQSGFHGSLGRETGVCYFDDVLRLELGGETLFRGSCSETQ